jgi:phosphatidylglycerol lysyltransferase
MMHKKSFLLKNVQSLRFLLGLATGLVGLTNMVVAIVPRPHWDLFLGAWQGDASHGYPRLIIVVGFFLLMLSRGMLRGKRQAWFATLLLLLVSTLLQMLNKGSILITIAVAMLAVIIALCTSRFRAKSDPPSIRRGYLALFAGLGTVLLYTIGGFVLLHQQFEALLEHFSIDDIMIQIFSYSHFSYLFPSMEAFVFGHALPWLCFCAVIYGIAQLLRPVTAVLLPDKQELSDAIMLTQRYGKSSISYFALTPEKAYFFSASKAAFLSYVLEGNIAVVAGDPIGPEEALATVMHEFLLFCQEQDWTVVFWQVSDRLVALYRTAGFHLLKIGEDAIIDTHTFTLAGKAMANVRSSAKRAEKDGLHVIFSYGPVRDGDHLTQMERISRTWLTNKGGHEKGFSMGHFDRCGDDQVIYALALDASQHVQAFVSFVPIYGRNGWGLDLMRRAEQTTPGTMELLLARSIHHLKEQGAETVSLGLAPLGQTNQGDGTLLENRIDSLTRYFGEQAKSQSLFSFKKKFQPTWECRYLAYSSTLKLPRVGWALYHAHQREASLLLLLFNWTSHLWKTRFLVKRERVLDVQFVHNMGKEVL